MCVWIRICVYCISYKQILRRFTLLVGNIRWYYTISWIIWLYHCSYYGWMCKSASSGRMEWFQNKSVLILVCLVHQESNCVLIQRHRLKCCNSITYVALQNQVKYNMKIIFSNNRCFTTWLIQKLWLEVGVEIIAVW